MYSLRLHKHKYNRIYKHISRFVIIDRTKTPKSGSQKKKLGTFNRAFNYMTFDFDYFFLWLHLGCKVSKGVRPILKNTMYL